MEVSDLPKEGGGRYKEDQDPDESESTWRYDWMEEPNFFLAICKCHYNGCCRKKSRKEKLKEEEEN